jgi:hypothetical protein
MSCLGIHADVVLDSLSELQHAAITFYAVMRDASSAILDPPYSFAVRTRLPQWHHARRTDTEAN